MKRVHHSSENIEGSTLLQQESLQKYLAKHKVGNVGDGIVCVSWRKTWRENFICKLHNLEYSIVGDKIVNVSKDYLFKDYIKDTQPMDWALGKLKLLQKEHLKMIGLGFKQIKVGVYQLESDGYAITIIRNKDKFFDEERVRMSFSKGVETLKHGSCGSVSESTCDGLLKSFIKGEFNWSEALLLPSWIRDWINVDLEGEQHEPIH